MQVWLVIEDFYNEPMIRVCGSEELARAFCEDAANEHASINPRAKYEPREYEKGLVAWEDVTREYHTNEVVRMKPYEITTDFTAVDSNRPDLTITI